ncbi:MAG: BlaI/MecI/CopY family transcriptional regulator [Solirubrobacteraceae bacterium]
MPRSPAPQTPPRLYVLEAEVMEEIWRQGEATVQLVMDALNRSSKRPRAYTTYMTVMRRLDQKRLLSRTRTGRRDTYVPRLSRKDYQERRAQAEISGLVTEFGDVALSHFAQTLSALDPERLKRLRRLAGRE